MTLPLTVLALGPLGSPPGIVVTLVVLTLIIVVGRFLLALAWRLVLIALAVIAVLWVLGVLGFSVGLF
jgi:low affinity Fe/Cu permease